MAGEDRAEAIRAEVRQWISENWDPELPLAGWRRRLVDSGWACPGWAICGRSLPADLATAATSELAAAGVPGLPEGVGVALIAPVLLEHGSDELQARFIRPTVTGEITWCQLFSEPGAGSDLAGLTTTARRDGDEWVVTGQKVWSTGAATADYGLLLARTDWDVPKCPFICRKPARAQHPGRAWREAVQERTAVTEPHKWYPQRAGRPDLVIPQAQAEGKSADPVIRQQIARLTEATRSARWTSERAAAARAAGRNPGPEGSLGKLASSDIARQAARVHGSIAGASGMLAQPDAPADGVIAEILVSVPGISIAGGTDEVQHTIIGERILGLPKEPDVSKDVPFRQVRR